MRNPADAPAARPMRRRLRSLAIATMFVFAIPVIIVFIAMGARDARQR